MNTNDLNITEKQKSRKGNNASRETPLQTYHHILFDSLMPWLPENNDPLYYRVILPDIMEQQGSFFQILTETYKKRNLSLASHLRTEWETFSHIPVNQRALKIYYSCETWLTGNGKVLFYQKLMLHTLLYSESLLAGILQDSSEILKKLVIYQWIKTIQDLRQRAQIRYRTENNEEDAAILFMADTTLLVLEKEIPAQYGSYCRDSFYTRQLNLLQTTPEKTGGNHDLVLSLKNWFQEIYLKRFGSEKGPVTDTETGAAITEKERSPETSPGKQGRRKERPLSGGNYEQEENREPLPLPETIGTKEVREMLGVGRTKLNLMCRKGEIPCFRVGRLYKFKTNEILTFIEKRKIKTHENY